MGFVGAAWIAACLLAPLVCAWLLRRRFRGQIRFAVTFAGVVTSLWGAAFTHAVLANTSSTAGIAFLFLPPLLVPAFAIAAAIGWALAVFLVRDAAAPRSRARTAIAAALVSWTAFGAVSVGRFAAQERHASDPNATPEQLRRVLVFQHENPRAYAFAAALLLRDGNTLPLARVAEHPGTPEDVLATLARDSNGSVAWRAIRNPSLGAEALRELARTGSVAQREQIANNPNAPVEVLAALAESPRPELALALARHPALPDELRDRLFERAITEGDLYVRNLAAVQPRMPPRLLARLAGDPEALVRRGAAANWKLPLAALEALAADPDAEVRRMAAYMTKERAERAPDPAAAPSP